MIPTLAALTFDCAEPLKVAGFWSSLLDRPLDETSSDDFASISGTPMWGFMKVPETKTAKNRMHVDLGVADLDAGVERAVALGAQRHGDFDESGYRWTTFTDPEGNEFDIVAVSEIQAGNESASSNARDD